MQTLLTTSHIFQHQRTNSGPTADQQWTNSSPTERPYVFNAGIQKRQNSPARLPGVCAAPTDGAWDHSGAVEGGGRREACGGDGAAEAFGIHKSRRLLAQR